MESNISENIIKYLKEDTSYETIVLKGVWGVGKTYLWNTKIEPKISEKFSSKIYYCSLFGLKNKEEVLTSLVFNTSNIQDTETTLKDIIPGLISATKDMHQVGVVGSSLIGIGKIFQKHVENAKLKDALIVLDDIERKDKNFSNNELMGLINLLKSKNNKILLMLNEEELTNMEEKKEIKSEWQLFKEKVIDIELTLDITTTELINILNEKANNKKVLSYNSFSETIKDINLKNIRIAQLILNRINKYIIKMETELPKELIDVLVRNCTLCYYIYYTNFENLSPKILINYIEDFNKYVEIYYKHEKENTEMNKEYLSVYNFLSNNNYFADDDFNNVIINDLKNGYILNEIDIYIEKAKKNNEKIQNDMKLKDLNFKLLFDINLTEEVIESEIDLIIDKEYDNYTLLFNIWDTLSKISNCNNKKIYDKIKKDALNGKIDIDAYKSGLIFSEKIRKLISEIDKIIEENTNNNFSYFEEKKLIIIIEEINIQKNIENNKKLLNKYSSNDIIQSLFTYSAKEIQTIFHFYNDIKNNNKIDLDNFLKSFDIMINHKDTYSHGKHKSLKRILNAVL